MLRTSWLWGSILLVLCFALVHSQGPELAKSDKNDVRQCWEDLASADASVAYRGMWRLVQAPRQTIAFLDQHLPLAVSPDPKKVEQFIRDLASDNFAVRNQANRELESLGTLVEPALQKALSRKLPLEAQRRMERLLSLLASTVTSPKTLRELRAVETLEIIGTREAKKLLHRLAQGAPLARLSREAKESLDRLGGRKIKFRCRHVPFHAHVPKFLQQLLYVIRRHVPGHTPDKCGAQGCNLAHQGTPGPAFVAPDESPPGIAVACRGISDLAASLADWQEAVFVVLAGRTSSCCRTGASTGSTRCRTAPTACGPSRRQRSRRRRSGRSKLPGSRTPGKFRGDVWRPRSSRTPQATHAVSASFFP